MFKLAVGFAFIVGAAAVFIARALAPEPEASSAEPSAQVQAVARSTQGCEDPKPEPLSLRLDGSGHAWGTLQTKDGQARVMVDTGASTTALSTDDARRLGLAASDPTRKRARFQTANGTVVAELDRLLNVRLGHLCVYMLDVAIMPTSALGSSLLGMNFMRKMRKVEVGQGRLVISQ
jgi:aspartyl protease family protein